MGDWTKELEAAKMKLNHFVDEREIVFREPAREIVGLGNGESLDSNNVQVWQVGIVQRSLCDHDT